MFRCNCAFLMCPHTVKCIFHTCKSVTISMSFPTCMCLLRIWTVCQTSNGICVCVLFDMKQHTCAKIQITSSSCKTLVSVHLIHATWHVLIMYSRLISSLHILHVSTSRSTCFALLCLCVFVHIIFLVLLPHGMTASLSSSHHILHT